METNHAIAKFQATGEGLVLSRAERERHVFLIGKSGSGKSTTLQNLAMADILAGEGVAFIDPHGDAAEYLLDRIPRRRTNQVCYLDAGESERPIGFNPLGGVPAARQAVVAAGIVAAFEHLWSESWGPRLAHYLFHGVLALIAQGSSTLIELPRLYTNAAFRGRVVRRLADPIERRFWRDEFESVDARFRGEAIAPILNKAGAFVASPQLRAMLGQARPKFSLEYAMDHRQIVIVNLASGRIGTEAANLLGSLIVSQVQMLAMARSARPPEARVAFYVHIDEFGAVTTEAFASLISEIRKFGVHLCLAAQFTAQLKPAIRSAVFGNCGTMMAFRVGAEDAEILEKEFYPLPAHVLTEQAPFEAWIKRGEEEHRPVRALPSLHRPRGVRGKVVAQSRRRYGCPSEAC
jgi:energy-coupling factor transporter ATP-binding protein EcfA2